MGAAGAKASDAYLGAEQKVLKCSQLCCSPFATLNPPVKIFFFQKKAEKKITNPSEKFSICLKLLCHQLLCFVSGAGWGDGDSQDRTRIGVWFAEILEELISFVVVCFCLSLSGTSFTDIPVYCWQLLLNKIIFSLPSRSFSYFLKISCVIQDCRVLGWPKLLVIIFSIFGLQV